MKYLFLVVFFAPLWASAAAVLNPGVKVQVVLPPIWNEETKTVEVPEYIMLQQAGSVDTCTFRGGQIKVLKNSGGEITFEQAAAKKDDRCARLVAPLEELKQLDPLLVRQQTVELQKKQAAFKAQLKEDVKGIIEKGGDPCIGQDSELKADSVYKISGKVFLYGQGTSATAVEGKDCQVELGSMVHVLGFNRDSGFAVAVYHKASESTGFVVAGAKHEQAATCKEGEQIVFPLARLKSYFTFAPASIEENMRTKGIVATIKPNTKVCANDPNDRNVTSSKSISFKHGDTFGSGSEASHGTGPDTGAKGKTDSAE